MIRILRYSLFFISLLSYSAIANNSVLEIEINIKDHKFSPDVINVEQGRKIRLIIHNLDPSIEEFDSIDLKRERIIPGNSTVHLILAPLKPGVYNFIGEFHQDTARGMLIVK